MYCSDCGTKNEDGAKFCSSCGVEIGLASSKSNIDSAQVEDKSQPVIKCGNCGYIGPGERGRSIWAQILAWIFFGWVTLIYYLVTHAYKCPKCHSTSLGIKRRDDKTFVDQSKARRPLVILLWVLLSIAIIGILSAVVLASLNTARQKAADAVQEQQGLNLPR